jgi:hypothetical protein
MPLEFCVGLSTFGFQFLASSARALLLLCGSVMAGIEQVFSVLSYVEVSTGAKSSHLPLRRPKAVYVITPLSAKFGATLTVDGFMIASGCSADPDRLLVPVNFHRFKNR